MRREKKNTESQIRPKSAAAMHDMMITPPRPPFLAVPPGGGGGSVYGHSIRPSSQPSILAI